MSDARNGGRLAPRVPVPTHETLEDRRLCSATVVGSATVYPTIQAAVNAAPVGGTVKVSAGTYDEDVLITKTLTVLGAQSGIDARASSRGRFESIVDGQDFGGGARSSAFYVTANDVTIDGFTVQGQTSGGAYGAGIVLGPGTAGAHVYDNIVRNNVAGLYLANSSATDLAVIRHNVFADNNTAGDNSGRGIYTDGGVSGGLLTNVLINANTFTDNVGSGASGNPEAAIGLEAQTAGKQSNITITNNVMANNGKGLLVLNATGVTFSGNLITGSTDSTSAAIRDEGNVVGMTVSHNTVLGGAGVAIRIDNKAAVGASANVTVNFNAFAGNLAGGLTLDPTAYSGTLDARSNYWGPGQTVSAGVLTSGSLFLPPPTPIGFALDNGLSVLASADLTILSYALSLRNLSLLTLLLLG